MWDSVFFANTWLFEYFIFNTFNMLTKQKLDTGLLRTYLVFQ